MPIICTNQGSYSSAYALLTVNATSITRTSANTCNVAISWKVTKSSTTSNNGAKYFHLVTSGTGSSSVLRGVSGNITEMAVNTSGKTSLSGTSYITMNGLNATSTSLRCAVGVSGSTSTMSNNGTLIWNGKTSTNTSPKDYQYTNLTFSNYQFTATPSVGDNISAVSGGGTIICGGTSTVNCTLGSTTGYVYSFSKWTSSNTTMLANSTSRAYTFTAPTAYYGKNVTLTASATRSISNYTLTVEANNAYVASVSGGGSKQYNSSVTVNATLASASGYTYSFANWTFSGGKTGTNTSRSCTFTMPAAAVTAKAYAVRSANTYTVTFNANGGGTPSINNKTVTYASTYGTLATISRNGHAFNGWYTSTSGGTKILSTTTVNITANQNLYAQWSAYYLTVQYNANGGNFTATQSGTTRYRVSNNIVQVSNDSGSTWSNFVANSNLQTNWNLHNLVTSSTYSGGLKKTGYSVVSNAAYNTAANGSGNNINEENTDVNVATIYRMNGNAYLTSNKTITLYVNWKANSYTVTLDKNGGSGGTSSVTATYASAMPTIASGSLPTRTGHTFTGYYDINTATGGTLYYTNSGASARNWDKTSNSTLYARWSANNYTTNFNNQRMVRFNNVTDIETGVALSGSYIISNTDGFTLNSTSITQTYGTTSKKPTVTFINNAKSYTLYDWYTYTQSGDSITLQNKIPTTWNLTSTSNYIGVCYGGLVREFINNGSNTVYNGTLYYVYNNGVWEQIDPN